jgi:hypothetical protein
VRVLRDDITSSEATRSQLITLVTRLSDRSKDCAPSLNSVNSTVLASLHTLLADRFLGNKEYGRAVGEYRVAESLFERAGPPDVMWLRELEGKAEAEVAMGRLEEARDTAACETKLARSWARDRAPQREDIDRPITVVEISAPISPARTPAASSGRRRR